MRDRSNFETRAVPVESTRGRLRRGDARNEQRNENGDREAVHDGTFVVPRERLMGTDAARGGTLRATTRDHETRSGPRRTRNVRISSARGRSALPAAFAGEIELHDVSGAD